MILSFFQIESSSYGQQGCSRLFTLTSLCGIQHRNIKLIQQKVTFILKIKNYSLSCIYGAKTFRITTLKITTQHHRFICDSQHKGAQHTSFEFRYAECLYIECRGFLCYADGHYDGGSKMEEHSTHNPKITGSKPASAVSGTK